MALPSNRLKKINIPVENETQTYDIVPEMLQSNGHSAALPTLSADATIAISTDLRTPLVTQSPAAATTILPYKVYNFGTLSTAMTITLSETGLVSGYCAEYTFRFTAGNGASITLPNTCKYNGGAAPELTTGHLYEFNIIDNLVVVGEFF